MAEVNNKYQPLRCSCLVPYLYAYLSFSIRYKEGGEYLNYPVLGCANTLFEEYRGEHMHYHTHVTGSIYLPTNI